IGKRVVVYAHICNLAQELMAEATAPVGGCTHIKLAPGIAQSKTRHRPIDDGTDQFAIDEQSNAMSAPSQGDQMPFPLFNDAFSALHAHPRTTNLRGVIVQHKGID